MDEEIHKVGHNSQSVDDVISDISSRGFLAWGSRPVDAESTRLTSALSSVHDAPTPSRRQASARGIMGRYNSRLNMGGPRGATAGVDTSGSDGGVKLEGEDSVSLDSYSGMSINSINRDDSSSSFFKATQRKRPGENIPYGAHHASRRLATKKTAGPTRCGDNQRVLLVRTVTTKSNIVLWVTRIVVFQGISNRCNGCR